MEPTPVIKAMIRIGARQRAQKGGQTGIRGAPAGPWPGWLPLRRASSSESRHGGVAGQRALPTLARAAKPGAPAAEYLGFAGEAKSLTREVPALARRAQSPARNVLGRAAHIFIAFLAYCLHVTLNRRLHPLAPGLTPRSVIQKFAAVQMLDVHIPTTDGRVLVLTRYTQPAAAAPRLFRSAPAVLGPLALAPPVAVASEGDYKGARLGQARPGSNILGMCGVFMMNSYRQFCLAWGMAGWRFLHTRPARGAWVHDAGRSWPRCFESRAGGVDATSITPRSTRGPQTGLTVRPRSTFAAGPCSSGRSAVHCRPTGIRAHRSPPATPQTTRSRRPNLPGCRSMRAARLTLERRSG